MLQYKRKWIIYQVVKKGLMIAAGVSMRVEA